jgi:GrpB-like predicted nucleotidyltransferase (UPF0157 family)
VAGRSGCRYIDISIEYIGSTSVPGLAAKSIIDLSIVTPSDAEVPLTIERLATLGYIHRGNSGIEGREAFKHPDIAQAYGHLKKQLADQFPHDIGSDVEGKTDFILGIQRQQGFSQEQCAVIDQVNRIQK